MAKWVNEAGWDRGLRVLGGALLLFLAWGATGTLQIVYGAIGVLLLVTGAVGVCPAYYLVGLNTCTLGRKAG